MSDELRPLPRAIAPLSAPPGTLVHVRMQARRRRLRAVQQSAAAGLLAVAGIAALGALDRVANDQGLQFTGRPRIGRPQPPPGGGPAGLVRPSVPATPTPSPTPNVPAGPGAPPHPDDWRLPGVPAGETSGDGGGSGDEPGDPHPYPRPGGDDPEPEPDPEPDPEPSESGAPTPAPSYAEPEPSPSVRRYADRPPVTEGTQPQASCPTDAETQGTGWCRWVTASSASDGVHFGFRVCRAAGQTQRNVTFTTTQEVEFEVRNATGTAVWTWSLGQTFARSEHSETIAPASCHTWSTVWAWSDDYGDLVGPGSYSVHASSTGTPVADFGASAAAFDIA